MLPAPPLSKARRRALHRYVERVRNALYLKHWRIDLPDEYPDDSPDEVLAQIDPCDGRYVATIRFGPGFWERDPETARETIVHELLHLHHVRVTDAVRLGAFRDELGQNAYDQLITGLKREAEYMTDVLTSLIAPTVLVPPVWPA
jgi:hypothetical protein